MTEPKEDRKSIFRKWLETLQQESWQLELLISGLALFGVFGAKDYIDSLEVFLTSQFLRGSAFFVIKIFVFLLKGSWYIFLINLLIHIILRGLWIGAIGLRYVSEDIDYEKLNFSDYFHKLYTRRYKSFDDYIEELEKVCSVIFAYTFLLFFILISACFFLVWPVVFVAIFDAQVGTLISILYIFLGLIVFIDFLALNPLKKLKEKWFGKIYGFIFRFYSTVTFSYIFRPLLLNFLDNKFTKRLFLLSIPYGFLIIVLLPSLVGESRGYFPSFSERGSQFRAYNSEAFNPNMYDALMPEEIQEIIYVSLSDYKMKSSLFEFFLKHYKSDELYFQNELNIDPINRVGVFSGFGRKTAIDSTIKKIDDTQLAERVAFLADKRNNKTRYSSYQWDSLYNELEEKHAFTLNELYADKMARINKGIKELCKFYIDDVEITDEVQCLISEHPKNAQKGWKCVTMLDSIDSGLHSFTVERGIYESKIKVISRRIIEIPFILDKS